MNKHTSILIFRLVLAFMVFLHPNTPLTAQFSVELSHIKPVNRFGRSFKAGPGIEFQYNPKGDQRGKWQGTHSFGFFRVTPQQDSLPIIYSILNEDGQDRFSGGYTILNDFNYLTVGSQRTYRPFYDRAFTPIGFFTLRGYLNNRESEDITFGANLSESAFDIGIGVGLGAGFEYATEGRYKFHFTVSRFLGWGTYQQVFEYWKTSLGATYFF